MPDPNAPAPAAHPSAVQYVRWALAIGALGLFVGGVIFQASSLAFDYMKLRDLPLYGSASSLPRFSRELELVARELEPQASQIRRLLRDRATIDIDVGEKAAAAAAAVTEAQGALRPFVANVGSTYRSVDAVFTQLCSREDNAAAARLGADLGGGAGPGPDAAATAPNAERTTTPQEQAVLAAACRIGPEASCEAGTGGQRLRLICAQRSLQEAERRKAAIGAYAFDGAKYFADALKINYPAFGDDDVAAAIQVVENYQTTVHGIGGSREDCAAARKRGASAAPHPADVSCRDWWDIRAPLWDWWLGWPLAILYLALAFVFGVLGALARYLYAFAAPVESPSSNPAEPIIAGGGAAVLAVLIVLGGFQFLTVGASSPDLAYPNPLTVCGLSVLAGLAGERVLAALQNVVARMFGGGTSAAPGGSARPTPPPGGQPAE